MLARIKFAPTEMQMVFIKGFLNELPYNAESKAVCSDLLIRALFFIVVQQKGGIVNYV